jgi:hypothetical protein
MKPVSRSELLDLGAYEELRDRFRGRVIEEKKRRRVALGTNMTVLFENRDTVLFQIQEMLRTERITQEAAIQHELETYNALVPGDAELSATVFIEYADRLERDRMLVELAGVERTFYLEAGGERCSAVAETRGERTDRTTAVHYVKFPLEPRALEAIRAGNGPVKLGVLHPGYTAEVLLDRDTLDSLRRDFVSGSTEAP